MTNNPSLDKGNRLEDIVEFVERTILNINPKLAGSKVEITRNKHIIANGINNEIDLYVEIDPGNCYKSLFIFECKNWKDKVDKNQIIVFSEKIKIANAQTGFFVANNYTKDAIAQSKKDSRIKILETKENLDFSLFPDIDTIIYTHFEVLELILLAFGVADPPNIKPLVINPKESYFLYKGEKKKVSDFVDNLVKEIADTKIQEQKVVENYPNGEYELEAEKQFFFKRGELFLDKEEFLKKDLEKLSIKIRFKFVSSKLKVISRLDIGDRGMFIQYGPINVGLSQIRVEGAFVRG
jgi:hypothetical protein